MDVTTKAAASAEAVRMLVRLLGDISLFLLAFLSIGRNRRYSFFAGCSRLLEPVALSPVNVRSYRPIFEHSGQCRRLKDCERAGELLLVWVRRARGARPSQ